MPKIDLPYNLTLRDYQIPLWKANVVDNVSESLVIWPRRNGKDLVTLNIVIARALQRTGLYLYIAPFYSQIRTIIWEGMDNEGRRFLDYIPPQIIADKSESRMTIELINGSRLKFAGSDNFDSMMGGNPVGIIRTEASLHKPDGMDYLRPIIVGNKGWALHNGTPRGMNKFFTEAQNAKKDPNCFFQHLTCEDTGFPTKEEIQRERERGVPESIIQQEYYTSFLSSSEQTLIPLDIIEPCINFQISPQDYNFEPKIIGVDPAFSAKGDKAIIAKRQGRMLWPLEKYQGVDNMGLASRIAKQIDSWGPDAVCIDAGRGEGVISRLIQLGFEDIVIPVNFQGTVGVDQIYGNMRAQIWCRMRDWIMNGVHKGAPPHIPNDQDLITGLSTPLMDLNGKNQVQLESKKQIRARGAYVMDEPDAVAVTFAEEISASMPTDSRASRLRYELDKMYGDDDYDAAGGYDPLNYFNRENEL